MTEKLAKIAGASGGILMIAMLCHEVNAAYCRSLGDDSQPPWDAAPEWQRTSAVNGVLFHLANPDAGDSASHDNWMAEKLADGWKFGETKDPEKKLHPCLVPFDQLPSEQQLKDTLFRTIVHGAKALALGFDQLDAAKDLNKLLYDEIGSLKRQLAGHKGQATKTRHELDAAQAELAARPPGAKARDVGEFEGGLTGSRLYELAVAAADVEVVATDGAREVLGIPPLPVTASEWRIVNDRLALAPEKRFEVLGPQPGGEPFRVAGYALFVDGELAATSLRDPQHAIGAGQTFNLAGDVAF
jgi:hypothetical protein